MCLLILSPAHIRAAPFVLCCCSVARPVKGASAAGLLSPATAKGCLESRGLFRGTRFRAGPHWEAGHSKGEHTHGLFSPCSPDRVVLS